jgi:glycolate oxidase
MIDFMSRLFTPKDLGMMLRVRMAFNPDGRCSPRKLLPTAGACIETTKSGRRAAL